VLATDIYMEELTRAKLRWDSSSTIVLVSTSTIPVSAVQSAQQAHLSC
jgi:hypothetical protein